MYRFYRYIAHKKQYTMSFGGHVLDMISRNKANQALKNARRDRHQRVIDIHESHPHFKSQSSNINPTITKEKVEVVKRDIRAKLIGQKRREAVATIIVVLILALSLLAFVLWV
jgi:hypothetical protein